MKKYILVILLLLFFTKTYTQNKLRFKIGTEYRITPIQKVNTNIIDSNISVYYDENEQLTGTAFNYSLGYFLKNNIGFGLSQSIRYSHIYYESAESGKSINDWITDFKIFVEKDFYVTESKYIFIELGASLMNMGTTYLRKDFVSATDSNGDPLYFLVPRNFSYTAFNLNIGFAVDHFDIGLGAYFSNGSSNFNSPEKFTLPYLKLNYIFGKKNKN